MQGIGNDIIEIKRIWNAIEKHKQHFLNRIFTQKEQEYCLKYSDSAMRFAGRFAAKEAVSKALGLGVGKGIKWHDIEIHNLDSGKPIVTFSKGLNQYFQDPKVLISISHCKIYATAIANWL